MIRRSALALSLVFVATTAAAQVYPPPAPPPVPPAPLGADAPVAATQVQVDGTVERFMINPNGDVDGMWLMDGTQVNFPPHLSADLQAAVRRGDAVSVQGYRLGSLPVLQASTITARRSGKQVVDRPPNPMTPPPAPPAPPSLTPLQADGRIERLIYGPRGETAGVLLSDGTVVRMPPPAALQYSELLRTGARLSVSGFGVITNVGRAVEATQVGRDRASQQGVFMHSVPAPLPAVQGQPGVPAVPPPASR
ncbi:hypothetical protein [Xanthomonas albilineans]|uniref:Secreted protein n=1 Tax=Xanthomonas albilineans (strain GPE PC73 / CFBP 7063) TaxID=380358 RepID=D2UFB5_XANAP|nr:hypothetical protein [Xanthomonas albilineans]PPU93473.1 hypothetical protein XalbCFBP2523_06050 [Xanthomonas albilineans]QHQ29319.1 hypothetical protein XaFJ1_GM002606 [Xanthomonas albilineans]CBA17076.1 conserved hypothetical protein [Xanthomonas albilineans GPE PC73]